MLVNICQKLLDTQIKYMIDVLLQTNKFFFFFFGLMANNSKLWDAEIIDLAFSMVYTLMSYEW